MVVTDFSVCNLVAHSLTTEESTNHAAGHLVSNCSTNGENNYKDHASFPNASEHAMSDAEEKYFPLSGKPYFTSIMSKSQVQGPYQLVIPRNFYTLLPNTCVPSTLCHEEKIWEMRYYGDRSLRRFDSGWKHFAMDNKLKIGDGCIFELLDSKNLKFQVRILRGDIPPEIVDSGLRYDRPILID